MNETTHTKQTVYVIDDDEAVRDSIKWLLESVDIAAETFESAQSFLDVSGRDLAGCMIVDVRLPGISGLDLQDRLNAMDIHLPVIIITGHGDVPVAIRAMKAGAFDFLEKPFSDQALLDRVREALRLNLKRADHRADAIDIEQRYARLSPRERQVMELVVQGQLNKQIASDLELSHKTIEVHRAHVMQKMEASSLAGLVRMAVKLEASTKA